VKIFFDNLWLTSGAKAQHCLNINKAELMAITDPTRMATKEICHEYGHLCGFGHGNNYKTNYKCEWSLPYYLSENVSRWL
jgi:hypothetical protein